MAKTGTTLTLGRVIRSGHCAFPQTEHPEQSHERCHVQGAGSTANPRGVYHPCPCPCHFPEERYECANCGGVLAEAPHWPLDEDGDVRYTHIDTATGCASGEDCYYRGG